MHYMPGMKMWMGTHSVALVVKNPPANAGDIGDVGSVPRSGRPPGGGNDNPPQCSCLENPMDRGGWWATVRGVTESQTWLNDSVLTQHGPESTDCFESPVKLHAILSLLTKEDSHRELWYVQWERSKRPAMLVQNRNDGISFHGDRRGLGQKKPFLARS